MDLTIYRNFGYCKVKWEIKNFCMLTCKNNWKIMSSEFFVRGIKPTKWRMSLQPEYKEDEDPLIFFCLERMEYNNDFEKVRANFSLTFDNYENTHLKHVPLFENFFHVNTLFALELECQSNMLNSKFLFQRDVLNIQCELLVYFENNREMFGSCCDLNLKQLSQELLSLYESAIAYDVELEVHNVNVKAHKTILYARSNFFFKLIHENPLATVIDMGEIHDIDALRNIIQFIYTGNLKYVLKNPSLSLLQFAEKFELKDAIQYYYPDQLIMSSKTDEDDYFVTWKIEKFSTRSEYRLQGPPLIMEKTQIRWKLRVYPVCFRNDEEFTAVFAEISGGGPSTEICIEFTLKNGDEYFYPKRTQKVINGEEINSYKKFFKRESLIDALKDKDLVIAFRLRISTGLQTSSIDFYQTSCSFVKQRHYENLLESFLYIKNYLNDVIILCNGKRFPANKCVLATRSPKLYNMLEGRNYLVLPIEEEILNEILHFLYTTTFTDEHPSTQIIFQLHGYAEMYEIKCLQAACSRVMHDNFFIDR